MFVLIRRQPRKFEATVLVSLVGTLLSSTSGSRFFMTFSHVGKVVSYLQI